MIHSQKWFKQAESVDSFNFQMSDEGSLRGEVDHILDNFNMQSLVRGVQKDEKKELKLERKKTKNPAYAKKELQAIDRLTRDLNKVLGLDDKVFQDVLNLMQLEQAAALTILRKILADLQKDGYDQYNKGIYYKELGAKLESTKSEMKKSFDKIAGNLNGLIRIIGSIKV